MCNVIRSSFKLPGTHLFLLLNLLYGNNEMTFGSFSPNNTSWLQKSTFLEPFMRHSEMSHAVNTLEIMKTLNGRTIYLVENHIC